MPFFGAGQGFFVIANIYGGGAVPPPPLPSLPPVISSPATANGTVGTAFSYQIAASNNPTSFDATGLPAGLSVDNSTGLISGTPTVSFGGSITISATNADGTDSRNVTLTIAAALIPSPVITSPTTDSGVAGASYNYQIVATNSPDSYGASGLPAGLSINTATGLITGTLPAAGSYPIGLSATNAGGVGNANLALTVTAALQPPVINSATTHPGQVGVAFNYTITATNSPTSFAATNLPANLTLNTTTGAITGTPTAAVTGQIVGLSATNAAGTGNQDLTVTITPATPVVSNPGAQNWQVGVAITPVQIPATNNPTSYAASNLPTGVTLDTSTGIISGTPGAGTQGSRTVGLTATNAGGTSPTVNMSVTVLPAAPVITSLLTATGQAGAPFTSYTIVASGATAFTATPLPTGLTFNGTTGVISGTIAAAQTPGPFNITIGASNTGGSDSKTLVVTIAAQAIPVITSTLTHTGTQGSAIPTYTIAASNNPTSFAASGLPSGLTVNTTNGQITGNTTVTGTHSVSITATNYGGTSVAGNLQLTINPMPVPVVSAGSLTRAEGTAFTYQINATNSPTSYAISGQPAGVSVNTTTGLISGTTAVAEGTYPITMTATNLGGTSAGAVFTLTIQPPPAGWTVNYAPPGFPSPPTVFNAITGRMPLDAATWVGWQAAYDADMTDALYDVATPGALPVNMWAKYTTDADYVLVPFDNFGGTPAANSITEWGYDSNVHAVYIIGSNSTSSPIQLRLVKTV